MPTLIFIAINQQNLPRNNLLPGGRKLMGGASASAVAYAYLRLRCLAWNPGKKEPSWFPATAQLATGSSIVISLFFFAVPALMPQQENILFFIYHLHRLPYCCTSENTPQFNTYVPLPHWVPTEEHTRNLAVSLYQQLHFAVFLQLCFVNSVPTHTNFQSFQNDISLLWP